MKYYALIISIYLFLLSCNERKPIELAQTKQDLNKSTNEEIIHKQSLPPISDSLKNKLLDSALLYGNTNAYSKVANNDDDIDPGLIFPALIMANKYNYPEACYHIYYLLCDAGYYSLSLELGTLDKKSKSIGLYYLLKAYELGFEDAKATIEEMYIDKHLRVPKSSDFIIFK